MTAIDYFIRCAEIAFVASLFADFLTRKGGA